MDLPEPSNRASVDSFLKSFFAEPAAACITAGAIESCARDGSRLRYTARILLGAAHFILLASGKARL